MKKNENKNNFDFSGIDHYMEIHDFLPADKRKIYNYINQENCIRIEKYKYVEGYLTRKELILCDGYGLKKICPRIMLGIQENFQ